MVEDVRAAVNTLAQDPQLDADKIWLFGYAMGGNVALHAAALESKVAGVVCIAGFTPMRSDTADKGTGGLARYSIERPLLPRLGQFIGKESQVPYDYDGLLGLIAPRLIAPRPVYVVSPKFDRDATPGDVLNAVETARQVYALNKADDKLVLDEPWDYNRLPADTQDRAIAWMKHQMQK
jgi:pimeloyl-ACP methyl ester carboxylesterase